MNRKHILALLAIVALAALPAAASAQFPGRGFYGGLNGYNGFGYSYSYNSGVGYVSPPPYFSLYPPVYYSGQIVRRPYGSSPFAYPSWYERPSAQQAFTASSSGMQANIPEPLLVMNPYVAGAAAAQASATAPAKIDNPFVASR
jgi:hypothetical protein